MIDLAPIGDPSSSVGDYLKAIWGLAGADVASTKDVADRLSVAPASVTNMFGRLRKMGLVEYKRYHGAFLTERGLEEALRLVRRHRLIEALLLEHLGYSWQAVHEEAESLEHAVSDVFTERLADFLGRPQHDPHGEPIPREDGTLAPEESNPLSEAEVGQRVRISRVRSEDASMLGFLEDRGLVLGRLLTVTESRPFDKVVTIRDESGVRHSLGAPLAGSVFVQTFLEEDG